MAGLKQVAISGCLGEAYSIEIVISGLLKSLVWTSTSQYIVDNFPLNGKIMGVHVDSISARRTIKVRESMTG